MTYLFIILAVIYGLLNILAGGVQLKFKLISAVSSIIMIIGGILIIISYFTNIYTLLLGLIILHLITISNGYKMHKKIHIKHHLIRIIISFILILVYVNM